MQLSRDATESWRVAKNHWNEHETRPKGLLVPDRERGVNNFTL